MEIARYIGLFLLKNQFCYVHGLGNMELNKIPARHDGKALLAPSYEVVVTPGGSIDDNLANFIATNEQISISKAANELREFSIQTRKDIAEGKETIIPGIGKFVEENGKVKFITDPNFSYVPAGIPVIRNSRQLEEQNSKPAHKPSYPTPHKADSVNWSMVILVVVLLIIIGGGAYGVWYYTTQNDNTQSTITQIPLKDTAIVKPQVQMPDSTQIKKDTTTAVSMPVLDTLALNPYKIVVGDYRTKDKADRRAKNLNMKGVETVQKDSAKYFVLVTVNCRMADTTHVKDSLKRYFGYNNVIIYK